MNKQDILNDLDKHSDEQLVAYVQQGVLSDDDLQPSASFPRKRYQALKEALATAQNRAQKAEQDAWAQAQKDNTIKAYEDFLRSYPQSQKAREARRSIERLQMDQEARGSWEYALSINTVEAYKDFLSSYPQSSWASEAHSRIDQLRQEEEDRVWRGVDGCGDPQRLRDFISAYPNSPRCSEAQAQIQAIAQVCLHGTALDQLISFLKDPSNQAFSIQRIKGDITNGKVDKDEFLRYIVKKEINLVPHQVLYELKQNGLYSDSDLLASGLAPDLICLLSETAKNFSKGEKLGEISPGCTEVYFWGIPSSGKTCALGALLKSAQEKGMQACACQGYGYMNELMNVFSPGEYSLLPGSTPTDAIYEMRFDLADAKKRKHPFAFVDLAGELFRDIHKHYAGSLDPDGAELLSQLEGILMTNRTKNRKIHFFVLEYNGHHRKIDGIYQDQYLGSAALWLKDNGVLAKDTDAIYILVTKSDLVDDQDNLQKELSQYIIEHYGGFYQAMRSLCEDNDINGKQLPVIPFSVGDVYLQNICKPSLKAADEVLGIIMDHSVNLGRNGWWGKLLKFFKA